MDKVNTLIPYVKNFLKGWLTYLVAFGGIAYALIGAKLGWVDTSTSTEIVFMSLAVIGIRRNMQNKGEPGRPKGT